MDASSGGASGPSSPVAGRGGARPVGGPPEPALRTIDFCAVAFAVVAVEYLGGREMERLRILDAASVEALQATLVIRVAQLAAIFAPLTFIRGLGLAAWGLRLGDWRQALGCAAAVSALLLVGFGLAAAATRLAGGPSLVAQGLGPSPLDAASPAARLVILAAVVVVGPLAEEIFFRGGLYAVLRRILSAPQTLVATSLFFAAVHGRQIHHSLLQFVGGLAFGWLYEKTGTLVAPVLVHAAGNLALLLLPCVV